MQHRYPPSQDTSFMDSTVHCINSQSQDMYEEFRLLLESDINLAVYKLKYIITYSACEAGGVCSRKESKRKTQPPWFDETCMRLKTEKHRLLNRFRNFKCKENLQDYVHILPKLNLKDTVPKEKINWTRSLLRTYPTQQRRETANNFGVHLKESYINRSLPVLLHQKRYRLISKHYLIQSEKTVMLPSTIL